MKTLLAIVLVAIVPVLAQFDAPQPANSKPPAPELLSIQPEAGGVLISWSYPANALPDVEAWTIVRRLPVNLDRNVEFTLSPARPKVTTIGATATLTWKDAYVEPGRHYIYTLYGNTLEDSTPVTVPLSATIPGIAPDGVTAKPQSRILPKRGERQRAAAQLRLR